MKMLLCPLVQFPLSGNIIILVQNIGAIKRISVIITGLFCIVLKSNSQDISITQCLTQKRTVDSIILYNTKAKFQENALIGSDPIMLTYKGVAWLDQSNKIRRIDINFDSSAVRAALFCSDDKIIAIKENESLFYNIGDSFYDDKCIKIISHQALIKFKSYNAITQIAKQIF